MNTRDNHKNIQEFDCEFRGFKSMMGLKINDGKYTIGSCIGEGCFGWVFQVKD